VKGTEPTSLAAGRSMRLGDVLTRLQDTTAKSASGWQCYS
jgi:hypothetical protein